MFDQYVIDRLVNDSGWFGVLVSSISGIFDNIGVDGAVNFTAMATERTGSIIRKIQSGVVQNYLIITVGVFVIITIFTLIGR